MRTIEKKPIAIIEPERLLKIASEPEVIDLLNQINEEYYYWEKVKHQEIPQNITAQEIWALIKLRRKFTPNVIHCGNHKFYWNFNNRLQEYLHFLDMNIGGSLESSSIISKEDKQRYLISSIMEEAIASSQIEGAVTTRKMAKEMLRKNQKPRNKSEQMIYNNYTTIQKILEIKKEPLTKQRLLDIHKSISYNTFSNSEEEGAFRKDEDGISIVDNENGRVVYTPPKEEEIERMLQDLFAFFNEDNDKLFIHPLIKASIIHFMIGYIHPFTDGNGRTSRALFYWYLLKKEYWLTEYLSISRLILKAKAQYARAFQYTEIDDNDLTYFILFNLKTMKLAFDELRLYIQRKQEEKLKLSNFIGLDGINYKQALILEWFDKEPSLLLTIKEAETRLVISNEHARKNLIDLSQRGYLDLVNINKKKKAFKRGIAYESLLKTVKNQPSLF